MTDALIDILHHEYQARANASFDKCAMEDALAVVMGNTAIRKDAGQNHPEADSIHHQAETLNNLLEELLNGPEDMVLPKGFQGKLKAMLDSVAEVRDRFSYEDQGSPYAFLQWKGTDACFDFHCKCGAHCHFDGYFAYYIQCPHCKTTYQMPFNLFPREVSQTDGHEPKILQCDEECQTELPQEECQRS